MSLIVVLEDDAATRTLRLRCSGQRLKTIAKSIAANDAAAPAWATHVSMGATNNVGPVVMQTVCGDLGGEAKAGLVQAK